MAMLHVLSQSIGMLRIPGLGVGNAVLMLVGSYGATWALATLSYSCIEEPFLRMRRSYGAIKPVPAVAPAA
jgi:peptidoglycan/LPS O-acetylase OafA/YrhL